MQELKLVKAGIDEKDLYYQWINDESVRKNSLHGHFVEYSEHCKWFEEKLQNPNTLMLICKRDKEYIGQVRVDFNSEGEGSISFSIDKKNRGQGFGYRILELLEIYLKEHFSNNYHTNYLIAKVKHENIASQKCFEKLGYRREVLKEFVLFRKTVREDENK